MECLVVGCNRPGYLHKWCSMHYTRWLRHGDPLVDLRDRRNRYGARVDGTLTLTIIDRDEREHEVLYSPESTELIKARRWHLSDSGYAVSMTLNRDEAPQRGLVRMHRAVLGLKPGDRKIVDHVNGDKLDNRIDNLRTVSPAINGANRSVISDRGLSRFRGVSWDPQRRRWAAYIKVDYRKLHLGRYDTEEEAAAAVAAFRAANGLPSY